jgi:SAM-dependent methyltransferase
MTHAHQTHDRAAQERDAFIDRMLQSAAGVFDVFSIYLGDQLGYYRALSREGALTAPELAVRTGTCERYTREWLEQQTVAGILQVEDAAVEAPWRRFWLPEGHAAVLVEEESLDYMAPLAQLLVGAVHPLAQIVAAYRSGDGVPFADYGADLREGQSRINRAAFLQLIGSEWLPAMPEVHARLQAGPPARVADVGCGAGWSCIGIARSYPRVRVDGFDLDEASVELARDHVREANLSGRVTIHCRDAGDPSLAGGYDLVTAFECLHDVADPVGVLAAMRRMAGEHGAVLVVDERVGDAFTARGNDVEWMMYGWSVLHCLPVGMAGSPSAATGTVMRTGTLRRYAREAGFRAVEVLPVENFFFRFYRLYP